MDKVEFIQQIRNKSDIVSIDEESLNSDINLKSDMVVVKCNLHGESLMLAERLLNNKYPCTKCFKDSIIYRNKYELNKLNKLSEDAILKKYGDLLTSLGISKELIQQKDGSFLAKCECGRSVNITVNKLAQVKLGNSFLCGHCHSKKLAKRRNDKFTKLFISKSIEIHGNRFNYNNIIFKSMEDPVELICKKHGKITIWPDNHLRGLGCQKCNKELSNEVRLNHFLNKAMKIHEGYYDYSLITPEIFTKADAKYTVICPKHGPWSTNLFYHANGAKCKKCVIESGTLRYSDWVKKVSKLHLNKYIYPEKYHGEFSSNAIVGITCPKHGIWLQRASSHSGGNGCKKCHIESRRMSKDEFVMKAREIHGGKYDYSNVVFTNNKEYIEIICPVHGKWRTKPNQHLSMKSGCPRCRESYGERKISTILDKLGIEYIREYKISGYNYRYDFYIPKINILIEHHGKQHYKPVDRFGGKNALDEVKKRDLDKECIASNLDIPLIVTNYKDLFSDCFENILIGKLKRIFKHWIKENGEIKTFKTDNDLCCYLNIPINSGEFYLLEVISNRNMIKIL